MSKNKNSPEQCSLSNPIERPKSPTIKVDCSCYQCKDHQDIPENKTQRPPWVLDPTVFGNGSSDLSYLKWWRRTWVKVIFLANPINTTIGEVTWCLHFLKNRFLHWRDLVWFGLRSLCADPSSFRREQGGFAELFRMVKGWELENESLQAFVLYTYKTKAVTRTWEERQRIYLSQDGCTLLCRACEQN